MNFAESDEEEEPQRVKFSSILQEEEYEDEEPESYVKELEDNVEDTARAPEVQGWDPREHSFFFHIQY